MADITLKYLTDLSSASGADEGDLLHINQSGNDRSITVEVLLNAMFNMRYPVGKVEWFSNGINPNTIWVGSTWARLPGAGKTIRLANATGSDVLQSGGNDSLKIAEQNLPAHSHTVNLTTDLYDHGTIDTTNNGSHIHTGNIGRSGGSITTIAGATADVGWTSNAVMKAAGDHVHKTQIGAHSHKVKGNTNDSGSGEQVNITNSFIKLAGWYRTA
ncbi:phage baseplate protein [Obesumbacterium proteus]|uniref:Baseplate structural protein Gp10 C-terminal domain-containing protein n=1 Tax=Obesumbacterium proteus ATCC 12841 TaxID=1354268 RepID=A0AA91EDU5_9GAMM|nr:hypothetical protein [Obesumbacterium proteus]AMO81565.1 hypothetical protein DSM2777_11300 [Obesumbacterium proteus]OAT57364.1 hypothetical protein M993_03945 [Obesumbacterium proteus ATCC 12841]